MNQVAVLIILLGTFCTITSSSGGGLFSPGGGGNGDICPKNISCVYDTTMNASTCPVWFICNSSGKCVCGEEYHHIIKCDQDMQTAKILDCYCATYDNDTDQTIAGACFANCGYARKRNFDEDGVVYSALEGNKFELNAMMCGEMNRTGPLCGKCENGLYPMVYSYSQSCVHCPEGGKDWWKFILVAYLPLTFMYFIVLFFQLNVTSSHIHGFIIFCQVISMPISTRILLRAATHNSTFQVGVKVLSALLGIWSFDFFRAYTNICLELDSLVALALEYIIALYPYFLMILTYFLIKLHDQNIRLVVKIWKPFRYILTLLNRNWDSHTSFVNVCSTFFTLSSMKILNVSFDFLIAARVFKLKPSATSKVDLVLYYDPSKHYFSGDHLPYGVLSLFIMLIFILVPMMVLFLYQLAWFQKILSFLPHKLHFLCTFIDTYQSSFKNGSEPGGRDCRWFSGMHLLVILAVFITFTLSPSALFFPFASILLLILNMMLVIVQPYKQNLSCADMTFITFIVLVFTSVAGINIATFKSQHFIKVCCYLGLLFAIIPILYVALYALYWIVIKWRCGFVFIRRLHSLKLGYRIWEHGEDEIEGSLPHRLQNPESYLDGNMTNF